MCGIAGCFTIDNQRTRRELAAIATRMADAIVHRGPDRGDVWVSEKIGLALSHRRLAIIDLSANGNQPMRSGNGGTNVSRTLGHRGSPYGLRGMGS
jgi:asparagine synthase (glutamine-hydrolysing)